jgi:hypothetical protein
MKWNWGYGIATLYMGFVAMMVSLVFMSMGKKVDLVTDNYYDEEVRFEEKMAKIKRASSLPTPVSWQVTDRAIEVIFPSDLQSAPQGEVRLYCPSNSEKDRSFTIQSLKNSIFLIPRTALPKGHFQLQIEWKSAGNTYLNEGVIAIR